MRSLPSAGRDPLRRAGAIVIVAVLAIAVGGCAKKSPVAVVTQPSPAPLPTCAPATVPPQTWPIEVPADLPKPKSSKLSAVTQENGVTIVRFDTSTSLREGLIPLLSGLRSGGFEIGRGDAEAREADVPFARTGVRGIFKMVAVADCHTTWVLGVTRQGSVGTGPTLPGFSPPPSAHPLPFG